MKKYLVVWAGSWPGWKTVASLSKLTRTDREFVKDEVALLFKVVGNEIYRIGLNGKIK